MSLKMLIWKAHSPTPSPPPPDSTGLAGATVTLATLEGTVINTTQTDSTGHYEFADVSPGFYNLTATKLGYWPDSDPVTVTADTPKTADILLCMIYDFNTNSGPADAGDLVMMEDATVNTTLRDRTYDLNNNGELADASDLAMLKDASVAGVEGWEYVVERTFSFSSLSLFHFPSFKKSPKHISTAAVSK